MRAALPEMAWITITLDTLKSTTVAALVEAVETAATAEDQPSPFGELMPGVISYMRRRIAANTRNVLDPDPLKIPLSLKNEALALLIEVMQPRIKALSEDQRKAADTARRSLDQIANGEPVDGVEQVGQFQSAGGIRQVSGSPRQATRNQLKGL